MRAVVQRVTRASVSVDGREVGSIGQGLLVLLGVGAGDGPEDVEYMVRKVLGLRIFRDESGQMNLSLLDVQGALLVVSQFTLYGDARKGRRPSFASAAPPDVARQLYESFVERARAHGVPTETGVFAAMMDVSLVNDGPVTILLDSEKLF